MTRQCNFFFVLVLSISLAVVAGDSLADLAVKEAAAPADNNDALVAKPGELKQILDALKEPPKAQDVHQRLINRLVELRSGANEIVPELGELTKSDNVSVRNIGIEALAAIASKEAFPALAAVVVKADNSIEYGALQGLVKIGAPSMPTLEKILRDPKTKNPAAIIGIVAKVGAPAIPVFERLKKDPRFKADSIRDAIYTAAVRSPKDFRAMWKEANTKKDVGPYYIRQALGDADLDCLASLLELGTDKDGQLASLAMQHAEGLVRQVTVSPEEKNYKPDPYRERREIDFAAAIRVVSSHRASLLKLVNSPEEMVRSSAKNLLKAAGQDIAVAADMGLKDPDPAVRKTTIKRLVMSKSTTSLQAIEEMARKDKDPEVQKAAAIALLDLDTEHRHDRFLKAIQSGDNAITLAVQQRLQHGSEEEAQLLFEAAASTKDSKKSDSYLTWLHGPAVFTVLHMFVGDDDRYQTFAMKVLAKEYGSNVTRTPAQQADVVKAVARLKTLMNDKSPETRKLASAAFVRMSDKTVAPPLEGIVDKDPAIRLAASQALQQMFPLPAGALQPLSKAVGDADPAIRMNVISALGRVGPTAVPVLEGALADKDANVRRAAMESLLVAGGAKNLVKAMTAATTSADPHRSAEAIRFFQREASLRESAKTAGLKLPPEALLNKTFAPPTELEHRPKSMGVIPTPPPVMTVEESTKILSDIGESDREKQLALLELSRHGAKGAAGVPAAMKLLDSPSADALVRAMAARALGRIGAPAVAAGMASLIKAIDDEDGRVNQAAMIALGELGAASKPALPRLAKIAVEPYSMKQQYAMGALSAIGEPSVPVLVEMLKDVETGHAFAAATAIAEIGPPAKGALPALTEILQKSRAPSAKQNNLPAAVIAALGAIGPAASPAVSEIVAVMNGPRSEAKIAAFKALGDIGPAAASDEAVKALTAALSDHQDGQSAAIALAKMGPAAKGAVPALKDALAKQIAFASSPEAKGMPEGYVFERCKPIVVALGAIGPAAAPALPLLEDIAPKAKSPELKSAISTAIGKIKGASTTKP